MSTDYDQPSEIGEAVFGDKPLPGSGKPLDAPARDVAERLVKLETHFDYMKRDVDRMHSDISGLRSDIAELKVSSGVLVERVSHLPSKGFFVKGILAALALIGAMTLFQGQMQRFAGLATDPGAAKPVSAR